jgi:hypothetical protein
VRLKSQSPDPVHLWIRHRPSPWPVELDLWSDAARGRLGRVSGSGVELPPRWNDEAPDDVLYLPPVAEPLLQRRLELAQSLVEMGVPVVVQHLPGDNLIVEGTTPVFDLLPALVAGDLEPLARLPAGASAIWPLIAGLTDRRELWERGLTLLGRADLRSVQSMVLDLDPADRRRLAALGDDKSFDALFHGKVASEREFARRAARQGFPIFIERPISASLARGEGNRRLAEMLATVAELWLRVGRPETTGQAVYRAARLVDAESHDLAVISREGNLDVIEWLDDLSRELVAEFASSASSVLLQQLRDEYLEADEPAGA